MPHLVHGLASVPTDSILVIGRHGQLARALAEAAGGRRLIHLGRPELDFVRLETLPVALATHHPSLIVNAAAYTAVDKAENDHAAAQAANVDGPEALATWCAAADIPLIHVSTDYVFDGSKGAPYLESDPPRPIGVYGTTKRAGELGVLAVCPKAIILRTSWVYAPYGNNFVLTMLAAGARLPKLRVVADQIGCPTSAPDLAAAILGIADRLAAGWRPEYAGIFHAAGRGATSWYGLAEAALDIAAEFGRPRPQIEPIATTDWPTPVQRPADSRLHCDRLEAVFAQRLPDWRDGLRRTVARAIADAGRTMC